MPLCTAASNQFYYYYPSVSDGAGGAIVTWHDYRNGASDIYARRVNASGTALWTADGVAVCTLTSAQQNPVIAPDGAGRAPRVAPA